MHKQKNRVKIGPKGVVGQVKKADKSVKILGVAITSTQMSQVLRKISLQRKEMLHIATVNPEFVMEARGNKLFAGVLANCTTVADGWGVVWADKILNHKFSNSQIIMERISGGRLVEEILKRANEKKEKVFLLGAKKGVAEMAATKMSKKYPGARLSWYEGARTVQVEQREEASMTIAKINSIEPDYLLVAYGSPWQDIWIEENRPYLRVRVAVGIGGLLDEWAGVVARCPNWLDQMGLKWVWRFVHQPWRWKRILRVFQFGALVIWRKVSSSFAL